LAISVDPMAFCAKAPVNPAVKPEAKSNAAAA
jgi:hypothetical protein